MKTPRESQPKNNYRDRPRLEYDPKTHEPKEHLHQSYRHWAWLPKPK